MDYRVDTRLLLLLGAAAIPAGMTVAAHAASPAGGISLPPTLLVTRAATLPPPTVSDGSAELLPFRTSSSTGVLPSLGGTVPQVVSGGGRTFYIDFAEGEDSNSGTSASQPWKHAPGDSAATGNAVRTVLVAGDTVRFKAGVPYRGTIAV